MRDYGKWRVVDDLGRGGQGSVHLALNKQRLNTVSGAFPEEHTLNELFKVALEGRFSFQRPLLEDLRGALLDLEKVKAGTILGALKVLHQPENDEELEKQLARAQNEIRALQQLSHPNIIKILGEDLTNRWFVMQYFKKGTLSNQLDKYKGDIISALPAFRKIVEAVSLMHDQGMVHRDIKPDNIFISDSDDLVLGDMGLVFFEDSDTRITSTFENVGSRNWMPGWAYGIQVEDVKPSFDVFCLGKLFWSMLSGRPVLQLWYYDRPQYDLETMFVNNEGIRWAEQILGMCVVEDEGQCLDHAGTLLNVIDDLTSAVESGIQPIRPADGLRRCRACGTGFYKEGEIKEYGFQATGTFNFKPFICGYCGHFDLFLVDSRGKFPAWRDE